MAKKSRTPPAPRRPVQAPKRKDPGRRDLPKPKPYLLALAAAGLVLVAIAVAVVVLQRGDASGGGPAAVKSSRVCKTKTYPDLGARHVDDLNAKVKYNSTPPTSGPHYFAWAVWGSYSEPINQVQSVHNLEHGGLIVQYGDKVPRATVSKLDDFYSTDANGLLMFPNPRLGKKIALTTWTQLMTCTAYDPAAFESFRNTYRYEAPERFPKQSLEPGQGPQS